MKANVSQIPRSKNNHSQMIPSDYYIPPESSNPRDMYYYSNPQQPRNSGDYYQKGNRRNHFHSNSTNQNTNYQQSHAPVVRWPQNHKQYTPTNVVSPQYSDNQSKETFELQQQFDYDEFQTNSPQPTHVEYKIQSQIPNLIYPQQCQQQQQQQNSNKQNRDNNHQLQRNQIPHQFDYPLSNNQYVKQKLSSNAQNYHQYPSHPRQQDKSPYHDYNQQEIPPISNSKQLNNKSCFNLDRIPKHNIKDTFDFYENEEQYFKSPDAEIKQQDIYQENNFQKSQNSNKNPLIQQSNINDQQPLQQVPQRKQKRQSSRSKRPPSPLPEDIIQGSSNNNKKMNQQQEMPNQEQFLQQSKVQVYQEISKPKNKNEPKTIEVGTQVCIPSEFCEKSILKLIEEVISLKFEYIKEELIVLVSQMSIQEAPKQKNKGEILKVNEIKSHETKDSTFNKNGASLNQNQSQYIEQIPSDKSTFSSKHMEQKNIKQPELSNLAINKENNHRIPQNTPIQNKERNNQLNLKQTNNSQKFQTIDQKEYIFCQDNLKA